MPVPPKPNLLSRIGQDSLVLLGLAFAWAVGVIWPFVEIVMAVLGGFAGICRRLFTPKAK